MKISLLHPATFKLDGGAMFGIIPRPLWEKHIRPDQLNRILMSLRVVLIETQNKKILIDTGIGDYHSDKFQQQFDIQSVTSPLTNALKLAGTTPEEITDIILTHLHFDHVGGLGAGATGQDPLFANATLHTHRKHYEYAQKPTARDQGSFHTQTFMPLLEKYDSLGRLKLIDELEGTLLKDGDDNVDFITSFGHTPYMIHPIFDGHIYMADLVPMSHHVSLAWVMGYDIEPGTTTVYKEKFYQKIMQENLTLIFEHDQEQWGGKLAVNEKGKYHLAQVFKGSKDIVQRI